MAEQDFRVEVDMRDEKMNYKIREAQTKKIPYTIVVGDKEKDEQLITYRPYGKNESKTLSIAEFVAKLTEEVKNLRKKQRIKSYFRIKMFMAKQVERLFKNALRNLSKSLSKQIKRLSFSKRKG